MAETSSDIRREIEDHRHKLEKDFFTLETRVRETADWRTHYQQNPMWFIGAAVGGGLLLSGLLLPRRRPPAFNGHSAANHRTEYNGAHKSSFSLALDSAKAAVVAFGMAKVKEVLADAFPVHREHLRATKPFDHMVSR